MQLLTPLLPLLSAPSTDLTKLADLLMHQGGYKFPEKSIVCMNHVVIGQSKVQDTDQTLQYLNLRLSMSIDVKECYKFYGLQEPGSEVTGYFDRKYRPLVEELRDRLPQVILQCSSNENAMIGALGYEEQVQALISEMMADPQWNRFGDCSSFIYTLSGAVRCCCLPLFSISKDGAVRRAHFAEGMTSIILKDKCFRLGLQAYCKHRNLIVTQLRLALSSPNLSAPGQDENAPDRLSVLPTELLFSIAAMLRSSLWALQLTCGKFLRMIQSDGFISYIGLWRYLAFSTSLKFTLHNGARGYSQIQGDAIAASLPMEPHLIGSLGRMSTEKFSSDQISAISKKFAGVNDPDYIKFVLCIYTDKYRPKADAIFWVLLRGWVKCHNDWLRGRKVPESDNVQAWRELMDL